MLLLLVAALGAQEVVWERTGQPDATLVNGYAKFIGDIDGDGCDDLVMLARTSSPQRWTPELWLLSGRDGRTLGTYRNSTGSIADWGPAGDMDGDGTPDFVFAVFDGYLIWQDFLEVRSGRDTSLILRLNNPSRLPLSPSTHVLGGRDLNGDGRPDLVLLWRRDVQNGIVAALDHTGREIYRHVGSWTTYSYTVGTGHRGNTIGWVGDIDSDGTDDFTVGSHDGTLGRYVALVLSGRTGLVLVKGVSAIPIAGIGWSADGCGDVDGDGVPDFMAGSEAQYGLVQVFSGRTGKSIREWSGVPFLVGGPLRGGGQDFDRDGVPDMVFYYNAGIRVLSGRDGDWTHVVPFCRERGGTSRSCAYGNPDWSAIEVGRPQPGNPYPVFVFPEEEYGRSPLGWPLGRIRMYRGTPPGVEPYGTACSGTLPLRPVLGIRDLQGRGVRLHLSNAPASAHVALLLGFSRTHWHGAALPLSLDVLGLPGCSLYTSIDFHVKTWTGATGLLRGYTAIDLPLPLAAHGTFALHGQWLVLDPRSGGAAASDALLWRH